MADKVEVEFKFKVGDFVIIKQDQRAWDLVDEADKRYRAKPHQFQIIERMYQQCYNTFQNHYFVRAYNQDGAPKLNQFTEPELDLGVL
jgi:hypothetical protein